jgi:hypothetical protein
MKLQECEIEIMLVNNKEKWTTKKFESLRVGYKATNEKCASCISEANVGKLVLLDREIVGLNQLVSQMEKGGGPSLYPLPMLCNLKKLKETSAMLNPCPFFDLCYTCHNYVF